MASRIYLVGTVRVSDLSSMKSMISLYYKDKHQLRDEIPTKSSLISIGRKSLAFSSGT